MNNNDIHKATAPVSLEKDRNAQSLDLMKRLNLKGMAEAFKESLGNTIAESMTPDSFLAWLLARQWDCRSQAAIERLVKTAFFRDTAYVE